MKISAQVKNTAGKHQVSVKTNEREHQLAIQPKSDGFGSSVNGGELLFLALATCYCNDLYREAQKRGIEVQGVEVEVSGEFGGEGEAAQNISYRAKVAAKARREEIEDLIRYTDTVAEIQNTLRKGVPVVFSEIEVQEL